MSITEPGHYHDGGGLYVHVTKNGGRSWIFRYSVIDASGKRRSRDMGLGPLKDVSLAKARELARGLREARQTRDGKDPIETRKDEVRAARLAQAKVQTFKVCAEAYIEAHKSGWRNAKHADQWLSTFRSHVWPVFGEVAVSAVDTGLVVKALQPIWSDIPETASRVRGRIEAVLDWAKAREFRDGDNPARWRGHLDHLLPAPTKVRKVVHHPALPYSKIAAFLTILRQQPGQVPLALEFLILTATRTSETTGARWSEISLPERLWIIPAGRIKSGREHRVPLSDRAMEILASVKAEQETTEDGLGEFVFPGRRSTEHMSNMSMLKLLARMGKTDITVHGFRSTFRDWVSETTDYSREVAEMALAHTVGDKVEAAYRRGDLFEKRKALMQEWSEFCCVNVETEKSILAA